MENIPYILAVGSLIQAQACTRHDIALLLECYEDINESLDHWRAVKKVVRYFQGTKEYMLTYRRADDLEVVNT